MVIINVLILIINNVYVLILLMCNINESNININNVVMCV